MARLQSRLAGALLALLAVGPVLAQAGAPAATASATTTAADVYRREVFAYQRAGRPDPFQPLLSAADLGYRVEDLRLTSIIYSPDPRASVAVFALADSARRFRMRVGQRMGSITVAAIYPGRVDLRVEDFGVARIESVRLQRQPRGQQPPPAAAQPGQPIIVQPPAQPAAPPAPLRRGGSRNNQPAQQPGTTTRPSGSRAAPSSSNR